MPVVRTGVSEGVRVTGADAWHAAGFTGRGVKVGVIDGGFEAYRRYLGTATVVARSFRADGRLTDPDEPDYHGTACALIVHEMAPDAVLYLAAEERDAAPDALARFEAAVDWLIAEGVMVISYSVGQDAGLRHDGTSRYAGVIDRARARGVFFAVAAGNSGGGAIGGAESEGHYGATFTDANGDGAHDFGGDDYVNVLVSDDAVSIALNLDDRTDAWRGYLLTLEDGRGRVVARATPTPATETPGGLPSGEITTTLEPGRYLLRVRRPDPAAPALRFDLYFSGAQFGQVTPAGSLSVPGDARGAVTVGQANWEDDRVFPDSSRGPTADGRPKPEIVAPACVASRVFAENDGDGFCGTSAATPHVAGAAALVYGAYPIFGTDALLAYLVVRAVPLSGPDADPNTGGAGRLALGPPPAR